MPNAAPIERCKHRLPPEQCAICRLSRTAPSRPEDSLGQRLPTRAERRAGAAITIPSERTDALAALPEPSEPARLETPAPADNGAAARRWWAQFTPEQRSQMARDRQRRRQAEPTPGVPDAEGSAERSTPAPMASINETPAIATTPEATEPTEELARFTPPAVRGETRLVVEIGFDLRELAKRPPAEIEEALRCLASVVIGCRELKRILAGIGRG